MFNNSHNVLPLQVLQQNCLKIQSLATIPVMGEYNHTTASYISETIETATPNIKTSNLFQSLGWTLISIAAQPNFCLKGFLQLRFWHTGLRSPSCFLNTIPARWGPEIWLSTSVSIQNKNVQLVLWVIFFSCSSQSDLQSIFLWPPSQEYIAQSVFQLCYTRGSVD